MECFPVRKYTHEHKKIYSKNNFGIQVTHKPNELSYSLALQTAVAESINVFQKMNVDKNNLTQQFGLPIR
jgi:hypothetical protein